MSHENVHVSELNGGGGGGGWLSGQLKSLSPPLHVAAVVPPSPVVTITPVNHEVPEQELFVFCPCSCAVC
jgi:hypothetical protein